MGARGPLGTEHQGGRGGDRHASRLEACTGIHRRENGSCRRLEAGRAGCERPASRFLSVQRDATDLVLLPGVWKLLCLGSDSLKLAVNLLRENCGFLFYFPEWS